jgi:uncharacterized protein (UPF0335 family)
VIREILEEAGRPLHREEIYARSAKHPLGPVNRSTMVTKLSRDPSFMNVEGLPGYWAITSWPLRKRSKGAIVEAGRMYAERLTRLEREVAFLRHETVDVRVTEQRARRLALERQAEAAAGVQLDPAHHEMLNQRAEEAAAQLTRMMARIDRREAMIRSLWDAAADARDALGEEAAKYPDLPPRFRETSDRATQSAGSDASASYDQGTDAETKSEGGDE